MAWAGHQTTEGHFIVKAVSPNPEPTADDENPTNVQIPSEIFMAQFYRIQTNDWSAFVYFILGYGKNTFIK